MYIRDGSYERYSALGLGVCLRSLQYHASGRSTYACVSAFSCGVLAVALRHNVREHLSYMVPRRNYSDEAHFVHPTCRQWDFVDVILDGSESHAAFYTQGRTLGVPFRVPNRDLLCGLHVTSQSIVGILEEDVPGKALDSSESLNALIG